MRIAIKSTSTTGGSIDGLLEEVRRAAGRGFATLWAPMFTGQDTLTALALAGREVPNIELGTAVVPIPLRSPFALAQQVRTVQEAIDGRLVLGLGTSHETVAREMFGVPWSAPLDTARTFVAELLDILRGDTSRRIYGPRFAPPEILLGAVNPGMARVAAEVATGVVLWAAGRITVRDVILPAAQSRSHGQEFRIVSSLPVSVTTDEHAARRLIHDQLGANDRFPSYRRVLEREGVSGIAELSLVGSAATVHGRLRQLADCGVTEFAAHIVGVTDADVERTWDVVAAYQ